jgi:hypothetical protein
MTEQQLMLLCVHGQAERMHMMSGRFLDQLCFAEMLT